MSDRMIPVPESAPRALAEWQEDRFLGGAGKSVYTLVACLPEPEPTFTDEEALAFFRGMVHGDYSDVYAIKQGRMYLTRLVKAGWPAPKALCPPPSPALVELVEAAMEYVKAWPGTPTARLRAAVAAYDEQEG